jgi:hypothetical protein
MIQGRRSWWSLFLAQYHGEIFGSAAHHARKARSTDQSGIDTEISGNKKEFTLGDEQLFLNPSMKKPIFCPVLRGISNGFGWKPSSSWFLN